MMISSKLKTPSLIFYTPNPYYTLLNLKPSKSTIRTNLELMPTHNLIKLYPPPKIHNFAKQFFLSENNKQLK